MGNYRFRLSDMMPNAWFYKLKDMSRSRKLSGTCHSVIKKQPSNLQKPHPNSHPRHSLYFSNTPPKRANNFHNSPVPPQSLNAHIRENSPRKSFNKRRTKRRTIYRPSPRIVSSSYSSSSVSACCSCHPTINSVWTHNDKLNLYNPDSSDYLLSALKSSSESYLSDSDDDGDDFAPSQSFNEQQALWSGSSDCKISSSTNDIIIDMNHDAHTRKNFQEMDGFEDISELELPPLLTKTEKVSYTRTRVEDSKKKSLSVERIKQEKEASLSRTQKKLHPKPISAGRKSFGNSSSGIKLGMNSPKIKVSARKRMSRSGSKGISDSFAVVKSSVDPQRDFRESMVEMIVENNIRESKDLEDLLASYLSLNSNEYHDLIIKMFEQIWFDMTNLRL